MPGTVLDRHDSHLQEFFSIVQASTFSRGLDSKCFRLCGPNIPCCITQLRHGAAIGTQATDECPGLVGNLDYKNAQQAGLGLLTPCLVGKTDSKKCKMPHCQRIV